MFPALTKFCLLVILTFNNYSNANEESSVVDLNKCAKNLTTTTYSYDTAFPIEDVKNQDEIFLRFFVKGSKDAHIIFSPQEQPADMGDPAYEIVLGSYENTLSEIRTERSGEVRDFSGGDVITDEEWRQFWIRINSQGLIEVGKGTENSPFLAWIDRDHMPINHYAFATYGNNEVHWALQCPNSEDTKSLKIAVPLHAKSNITDLQVDDPQCLKIRTDVYEYNATYPIIETHYDGTDIFLTFSVKSATDVSIALFTNDESTKLDRQIYEIVLGHEYDTSEIRLNNVGKTDNSSSNVLSADEWRPFWIRISSDRLFQVGKGAEESAFMSWKADVKPMPIDHYGFCSSDGNTVNWAHHCPKNHRTDLSDCAKLFSTKYEYHPQFQNNGGNKQGEPFFLSFYIKAERDAHIILSPNSKSSRYGDRAYEIVIGTNNNTCTAIRSVRGGSDQFEHLEDDMLNPNEWRPFWIRVSSHGLIEVGKEIGNSAFISWHDEYPMISTYSVASYDNGTAEWIIECSKENFATSTDIITTESENPTTEQQSNSNSSQHEMNLTYCNLTTTDYDYDNNSAYPITVKQLDGEDILLKFYVKADKNAHVVLSPTPTTEPVKRTERAYEIVLGAYYNNFTVIRTARGATDIAVYESGESTVLSPSEWRQFWIRVKPDGLIQVGKESESIPFLAWQDDEPMPIIHFGLASYACAVNWAFDCF